MKLKTIAGAALALSLLGLSHTAVAQEKFEARVTLNTTAEGPQISPNIYGQFVEHLGRGVYEGIWVGEDSSIPNVRGIRSDVVAALKKIKVPLVRWPGGCFAEIYHWQDGVGPREDRSMSVNSAWGDEPETNHFGSNEFMDFMGQIGAQPFLSVNLASGTPAEAQAWLQYLTGPADSGPGKLRASHGHPEPYKIPYIGIGNETWGCGGNMTAEYYADLYRQYFSVLQPYGEIIASDANSDDYDWTETLLEKALYRHDKATPLAYISRQPQISMISIHFYTFSGNNWGNKSDAIGFTETDWATSMERTLKTEELIVRHSAILDRYDPQKRIGISFSEWGAWWNNEKDRPSNLYQANTWRDGIIAGLSLNIFQNHADRVKMANIAQMVNVLQAMILTRGEQMIVTPSYHIFDMYQVHQGATLIPSFVSTPDYVQDKVSLPAISASASRNDKGEVHISLVNIDPNRPAHITLDTGDLRVRAVSGKVLTAPKMDTHPDFDRADPFVPVALKGAKVEGRAVSLDIPSKSVVMVTLSVD